MELIDTVRQCEEQSAELRQNQEATEKLSSSLSERQGAYVALEQEHSSVQGRLNARISEVSQSNSQYSCSIKLTLTKQIHA